MNYHILTIVIRGIGLIVLAGCVALIIRTIRKTIREDSCKGNFTTHTIEQLRAFQKAKKQIGKLDRELRIVKLKHVFEPCDSERTEPPGVWELGLILFLIKHFTDYIGGTIVEQITENNGKTFIMNIPCYTGEHGVLKDIIKNMDLSPMDLFSGTQDHKNKQVFYNDHRRCDTTP